MKDRVYKFADFELAAADGELRNGNSSIRLQDKPLLLLIALIDHSKTLVTREQLRERMWDSDTFVDYEQGINVAVKKVRDALGDSAENPKYIQTVAKKGYKFLLPVEVRETDQLATVVSAREANAKGSEENIPTAGRHSARSNWIFAGFTGVALVGAGLWLFHGQSAKAPHTAQIRSLAVLPLRNLSPDPTQDYFADGITEDLITNFAQSFPLRIISRTSVMRYKETTESIAQIAQELGVEAIVEGAVARSGNRVTVTVQLIDTTEDRHLWARKYDRDVKNLLDVEAEISQEIAAQVGSTLTARHAIDSSKSRPPDPQVYELCLLGRYHWNKRTAAGLAKAAEYYQQAIDRDPNYAPAYAGLANSYALMPSYDSVAVQETYAKATAAARHALELDGTLAEAHAALGIIALNARVWEPSGPEFRQALALNPNYATAHHWLAFYLFFLGQTDEAIAEVETARQLDPLSAIINADEGAFLYAANRYGEARVRLRRAIELQPGFDQPHETLALTDLETGNPSEALKEARAGLALGSTNPRTLGEAGYLLAATGHTDEARKLLLALQEMARHSADEPLFEALIDVGLKERDQAVGALEQDAKIFGIVGLSQWHAFNQLNADPRYQRLIAPIEETKSPQLSPANPAR
jgi:TolB-like protein/DNA-binding winged helix-turn-helix (wHTH) protein/Tfp pilus assembly protein PilF